MAKKCGRGELGVGGAAGLVWGTSSWRCWVQKVMVEMVFSKLLNTQCQTLILTEWVWDAYKLYTLLSLP